ncbi:MAG: manganese/iron transport system substrate-binding protein [Alphaproteobacteria bacterium]|jgi:zinc/manganese transport system substrate-binding protein/zinc transport system substrate-binding protein|nr:manganese/iron transport system substrate-binding protein [Alphaproteobacteria bacterium]
MDLTLVRTSLRVSVIAASLLALAPTHAQDRLAIVTTTGDLRSLAEAVGGDRVAVTSLVPPRFDPEEYQPKPQDLARVKNARLAVRVGLDFDLWFDRLLVQAGIARTHPGYVDASYAISALDVRGATVGPGDGHAHGSGNPHYWLDPRNADIITGNILEGLARVDAGNRAIYESNRLAFLARLEAELKRWEDQAAPLNRVPLVAYHNSWAYLARRFRLDFIGFVEPKPGVPPSPAQLAALIRTMDARGARIIVRQPHEPEKDVGFLAKRTGSAVALLAASVGALPDATDYLSLFDVNIAALLSAAKAR